jgi:thiol-disulfide isomerase/thioredoxin
MPSTDSEPIPEDRPAGSRRTFWIVFGTAAVVTTLFALWIGGARTHRGGLEAGKPAPPIQAEGWLNGTAPEPGELVGRVLVVHAWSPDCPICFKESPDLIRLQRRYADRGVRFIGLTAYGSSDLPDPFGPGALPAIRQYLEETGIDWLNGYGAMQAFDALHVEYLPSVWVINRQGRIVWSKDSPGDPADAIDRALRQRTG